MDSAALVGRWTPESWAVVDSIRAADRPFGEKLVGYISSGLAVLVLLFGGAGQSAAQWTNVVPPDGQVKVIVIDPKSPDTLYAGIELGGVFKSTDGGASWTAANSGLMCDGMGVSHICNVYAVVVDPTAPATLYAGAGYMNYHSPGGVFKSVDGGASWTQVLSSLCAVDTIGGYISECSVYSLALDPQTPATIYAGGMLHVSLSTPERTEGGIAKSSDGGNSWVPMRTGLNCSGYTCYVTALAVDPETPTTLYAGTNTGVHMDDPDPDPQGIHRWCRRWDRDGNAGKDQSLLGLR